MTSERVGHPIIGLDVLRGAPGWTAGIARLGELWSENGAVATRRAQEIGGNFRGRRGQMVLDVVLSNQRAYDTRVVPLLDRWLERVAADGGRPTLEWLLAHEESYLDLSLKRTEAATIAGVASALVRFGEDNDLDTEDAACEAWARGAAGLEIAHDLDPYVGQVSGIGPALFAYCKLLCGADTLKPDTRVQARLQEVGLMAAGQSSAAVYVVACAVAHELEISLVELDQLLWYRG